MSEFFFYIVTSKKYLIMSSRQELLDRLRDLCYNAEDPITLDAWEEMNVNQLRTIVALLDNEGVHFFRETQQPPTQGLRGHCFLMESIITYINTPRQGPLGTILPPVHPVTRRVITPRQQQLIRDAYAAVAVTNHNNNSQAQNSIGTLFRAQAHILPIVGPTRVYNTQLVDITNLRSVVLINNIEFEAPGGLDIVKGLTDGRIAYLIESYNQIPIRSRPSSSIPSRIIDRISSPSRVILNGIMFDSANGLHIEKKTDQGLATYRITPNN
jgi:hypothetical protein